MNITDGFGIPVDQDWLGENLFNYLTFDEAALLVAPKWTRHYFHKELKMGRLMLGELLIVTDPEIYGIQKNAGIKYFISRRETERIKEDYEKRPKKKATRCPYCRRVLHYCDRKPCRVIEQHTVEFRDTIETVAEFFERYLKVDAHNKQRLEAFNTKKRIREITSKRRFTE